MRFDDICLADKSTPQHVLDEIARVGGLAFLEEPWTREMLGSMAWCERGTELEKDISVGIFAGEIAECVEQNCPCVYYTSDLKGVLIAYLASELPDGVTWDMLEETGRERGLSGVLTAEQKRAWDGREEDMDEGGFVWDYPRHDADGDFMHIISFAVAHDVRGTGVATKLMKPFIDKAREMSVPIYLECLSDRLERLYGHYGFETVEERHVECADIYERIMVLHP